jgi:hypothetical protein
MTVRAKPERIAARLGASVCAPLRGQGESYSDVILRLVELEAKGQT